MRRRPAKDVTLTEQRRKNMEARASNSAEDVFRIYARKASAALGSPFTFLAAVLAIVIWACTGPIFRYSDTWQLVINTGTTIVTFLMVFVIQNTQNRDSISIQLKLDELIKSIKGARNSIIDLDRLTDAQLQELTNEYKRLCDTAHEPNHRAS
jgi:low affinity Fe/Cu permease